MGSLAPLIGNLTASAIKPRAVSVVTNPPQNVPTEQYRTPVGYGDGSTIGGRVKEQYGKRNGETKFMAK